MTDKPNTPIPAKALASTPGPWIARGREVEAAQPGVGSICTVGNSGKRDLDFADARLIAAAPDMYGDLAVLIKAFGASSKHPLWERARKTLAKAKGQP